MCLFDANKITATYTKNNGPKINVARFQQKMKCFLFEAKITFFSFRQKRGSS